MIRKKKIKKEFNEICLVFTMYIDKRKKLDKPWKNELTISIELKL